MWFTPWERLADKDKVRRTIYLIIFVIGAMIYTYSMNMRPTFIFMCIGLIGSLIQLVYFMRKLRKKKRAVSVKRYNKLVIVIIVIIIFSFSPTITLIGRAFGLRAYTMRADDMSPTIENGDKVVIYKRAYRNTSPSVGDIVALVLPENKEKMYVGRIARKNKDNSYYVSSDNKTGRDSRVWGNIPRTDIIGEAVLIYRGRKCIYNKLLK